MLRTIFVFAILFPGVIAGLFNRYAALLIYIWFALFRPQEWMWWDISNLRLSLVLGLLLVVPSLLTGVFPYIAHPISIGCILFLISGLLGQFSAYDPGIGWYWLDFLFRLVLVCLLAVTLISDQRRFRLALIVVAVSFGFHAAKAGLATILGGGLAFGDGLAGAFVDNNGYAVGMAMVTPLLVGGAQIVSQKWLRRGFYVAAALIPFAIVSTYSRGGFLAVGAAGIVLLVQQRRRGLAIAAAILVSIPLYWFISVQQGYVNRLESITTYEDQQETSALSRLHFWRVAIEMAKDHPFGIGLFNYESAYDLYDTSNGRYGERRAVHSSPFQVLAETGFLGAAIYMTMLFGSIRMLRRIRRRGQMSGLSPDDARLFVSAANALIASMVAFIVGGSFVAMALNDLTWFTFALIASLDLISERVCVSVRQTQPQQKATVPATAVPWPVQVAHYR